MAVVGSILFCVRRSPGRGRPAATAVPMLLLLLLCTSDAARGRAAPAESSAAARSAAELLPATTAVYAEMAQPERLLTTLRQHPLRQRIESLDAVRTAQENKKFLDFKAGVAIVESKMEMPWHKLLPAIAGGGVYLGIDSETRGIAVLLQAPQDGAQERLVDVLLQLARADAAAKRRPEPVETGEYRNVRAYGIGQAKAAIVGKWLVITNHNELRKRIIDAALDGAEHSLAADKQFQQAQAGAAQRTNSNSTEAGAITADSPAAWGYLNLAEFRRVEAARKAFTGRAENPLAELLFGGLLAVLPHAPFATATAEINDAQLELVVGAPFDAGWAGEAREHFFGPQVKGTAPPLLLRDDCLLSLSAYRDISAMWLRAGDLFDARMNEELAKADSNLATLFGGKDFGEDILGSIQPEIQFVVARQPFTSPPAPAIKIPAFALAAELRDPEAMRPELRRTFQSLIGFLNIVGAMNGQPQFDQEVEKTDDTQLLIARYLPDARASDPLNLKIHFNFSPTLAFAGRQLVISSTEGLARRLIAAPSAEVAAANPAEGPERTVNTVAEARFAALREVLADNRGQLVAQNMLKEGHTKEEAEKSVDMLLELIGWLDRARLQLDHSPHDLQLMLGISLRPSN